MNQTEPSNQQRRISGWQVATAAAAVLLLWFGVQNSSMVNIHFWVRTLRAPLIVVIVVAAMLGALIVAMWRRSRPRT